MPSTPIPAADVAEFAALHPAPTTADLADVLAAADAVEARLGA